MHLIWCKYHFALDSFFIDDHPPQLSLSHCDHWNPWKNIFCWWKGQVEAYSSKSKVYFSQNVCLKKSEKDSSTLYTNTLLASLMAPNKSTHLSKLQVNIELEQSKTRCFMFRIGPPIFISFSFRFRIKNQLKYTRTSCFVSQIVTLQHV